MSLLHSRTYADLLNAIIVGKLSIHFTLLAHASYQFRQNWIPEKTRQYPIKGEIDEILSSLSSKIQRLLPEKMWEIPEQSTNHVNSGTGWSDKRKSLSGSYHRADSYQFTLQAGKNWALYGIKCWGTEMHLSSHADVPGKKPPSTCVQGWDVIQS